MKKIFTSRDKQYVDNVNTQMLCTGIFNTTNGAATLTMNKQLEN